jgi:hypothetical protein
MSNLEPETMEEAYAIAAQYLGHFNGDEDLEEFELLDAGVCDDCRRAVGMRRRYGKLELCRHCARSRLKVRNALSL